jgi:general secretion pathway protein G
VNKRKRRLSVTLIEMIIVMILIATITGALAFNYQKSLDRGKLFATKQRVERLRAILTLYFSEHPDEIDTKQDWATIINESGLGPPKAEDLLKDDFGEPFTINLARGNAGTIDIHIDSRGASRALKE